jgi:glucose-6-phosphate-specific signal transduction histidine kinase
MNLSLKRLLFWTPRILCLLFAAFISIFALDVFGEGYGFWKTIPALMIHLIPTWIVLAVLALAWRWEWVGGTLFVALGILYLIASWGRFHWSAYLCISGPLFLIGILFFLNWLNRRKLRTGT